MKWKLNGRWGPKRFEVSSEAVWVSGYSRKQTRELIRWAEVFTKDEVNIKINDFSYGNLHQLITTMGMLVWK